MSELSERTEPQLDAGAAAPRAPAREGPQAWAVVGAAFVSMFTVFGVAYSFGAFFQPMAREFQAGSGATSAVFAITAFCYFTLGAISGAVADRLGPRRVLLFGALVMGSGLVLTAISPSIWVGYLTYGLGVGIGTACGYVPMVAAVGGWFDRRRALAIGIAVTGIGVGTLAAAPLAEVLILRFGWRVTYAVFGVASFLLLAGCAGLARRPPASSQAPLRLGRAVRTREFATIYATGLLTGFSLFMAFVHLVPYATSRGTSAIAAASLIGVIGVGSSLGRLALGGVADRLGSVRTYQVAVAILTVSFVVWYLAPDYTALAVFAFLLGLGYGGWVALSASVVAELFGPEGLGGSIGALYTSAGVGALVGPPLAGFLVAFVGAGMIGFRRRALD
jgi:MFS family permease